MSVDDRPGLYVESTIIMTTVRLVAPFVLTFALFIMFHGADSPGGGFQGGVIAGSVIMMLAFAYGIESTRQWVDVRIVSVLASGGVLVFAAIGLGTIALGGQFLVLAVRTVPLSRQQVRHRTGRVGYRCHRRKRGDWTVLPALGRLRPRH